MKKRVFILFAIIFVIVLSGCDETPYILSYTNEDELIEVEVGTELNLDDYVKVGEEGTIETSQCEFKNLPDYNTVGEYQVDCHLDEVVKFPFTVYVVDTQVPVIAYPMTQEVSMKVGTDIALLDYITVTDNYYDETNIVIEYDESIDLSVVGSHTVTYTVTDGSNNQTEGTVTFNITQLDPPNLVVSLDGVTHHSIGIYAVVSENDYEIDEVAFHIYDGENLVRTDHYTELDFHADLTGLNSNTEYTVEIVIEYTEFTASNPQGVEQTITRVIDATTLEYTAPVVNATLTNTGHRTSEVTVEKTNQDNLDLQLAVVLYQGEEVVRDLVVFDTDIFTYTDLDSNSSYTLVVIYSYDLLDGNGMVTKSILLDFDTATYVIPTVEVEQTSHNYHFGSVTPTITNPDELDVTITSKLFDGETFIQDGYQSGTKFNYNELLSGHTYKAVVYYTYDLYDGNGPITEEVETVFTTDSYVAPLNGLSIMGTGTNSLDVYISYNLTTFPYDSTLTFEAPGEAPVVIENPEVGYHYYTELFSSTEYTFTYQYSYDLLDGNGLQEFTFSETVSTASVTMPTIELVVNSTSATTATFDFEINDPDGAFITNIGARVFRDLQTPQLSFDEISLQDNTFTLDELPIGEELILEIVFSYDLRDGNGSQNLIQTYNFTTTYHDYVSSTPSEQTVMQGSTIEILVALENNISTAIESIEVDGNTYSLTHQGNNVFAFDFTVPTDTVGTTSFDITGFTYSDESIGFVSQNPVETFVLDVFEPVTTSNLRSDLTNEYVASNTPIHLELDLINPNNHTVTSITVNEIVYDTGFTVTNNVLQFEFTSSTYYGFNITSIDEITFQVGDLTYSTTVNEEMRYYVPEDMTVYNIYTEQDLLDAFNTSDMNAVYVLQGYINLSAHDWSTKMTTLSGYFDGNGYKINYLQFYTMSGHVNIGMFDVITSTGFVKDLRIERFDIEDMMYMDTTTETEINIGSIAGTCYGKLENIYVQGDMTFTIDSSDYLTIGGIAGKMTAETNNLTSYVTMDVQNTGGITIGGVFGRFEGILQGAEQKVYVTAYSTNGNVFAGSIIGETYFAKVTEVSAYLNLGVYGASSGATGHLIGKASFSIIENYITKGTLTTVCVNSGHEEFYTGGIIGYSLSSTVTKGISDINIHSREGTMTIHTGGIAGYTTGSTYTDLFVETTGHKFETLTKGNTSFTFGFGDDVLVNVILSDESIWRFDYVNDDIFPQSNLTIDKDLLGNVTFYTDTLLLDDTGTIWTYTDVSIGNYPYLTMLDYTQSKTRD